MEIILHNHPDSGRRCRGSERGIGGVGRHSGREDWPQSDRHSWRKNHGEFGGDTTIINCTVVIAGDFFYFLPIKLSYSNRFECPRNGVNDNTRQMLPKSKATTKQILIFFGRSNHRHHTLSTSMSTRPDSPATVIRTTSDVNFEQAQHIYAVAVRITDAVGMRSSAPSSVTVPLVVTN